MSVDYFVWRGPKLSSEQFGEQLELREQRPEKSIFEPSTRLKAFRRDVLQRYGPLESLVDVDGADQPWAMTPEDSASLIELNFRASANTQQVTDILRTALRRGLYLYDAQSGEIFTPGPERWQIWLRKIGLGRLAGSNR